jgi:hypothetical protein
MQPSLEDGKRLVEPETIAAWRKRIDEDGSSALVQLREPVNRFPDFVRYIVQQLRALCPSLGKVKIAHTVARACLHLCATTVARQISSRCHPTEAGANQSHGPKEKAARVFGPERPCFYGIAPGISRCAARLGCLPRFYRRIGLDQEVSRKAP